MTRRDKGRISPKVVALNGVLTALSVVLLYVASMAPSGRMGLAAVAGLVPACAVISGGLGAGALCYGATAILGLLLAPGKDAAILYCLFFGLYALVKAGVERLRRLPAEWALKLLFFNGLLSVFLFGLSSVFFASLPLEDLPLWIIYPAGNVVFVIYDLGFSKLIGFYLKRVEPLLRKR